LESLAAVKEGRRHLTGQIRDARVAIVGEKRGISERRSGATSGSAWLGP
jgi:hypothetical protein